LNIRLYMDENAMAVRVVAALRSRAVDLLTASEAKMLRREDEDQLAFATAQARVLYTFNQGHFLQLHTDWSLAGRAHSGIILARQKRYSDREQIRRLSRLVQTLSAEEMRNRVEFLSRW
jgi:Domain of unknown function (DUF5615)